MSEEGSFSHQPNKDGRLVPVVAVYKNTVVRVLKMNKMYEKP